MRTVEQEKTFQKVKLYDAILLDVRFICEYTEGMHHGFEARTSAIANLKRVQNLRHIEDASYEELRAPWARRY